MLEKHFAGLNLEGRLCIPEGKVAEWIRETYFRLPNVIKFAALASTAHSVAITVKLCIVYCWKQSLDFLFLDNLSGHMKLQNIALLHLSITYFISCTMTYTVRWTHVPHKVTRCTELQGTQCSAKLILKSTNFYARENQIFPALISARFEQNLRSSPWEPRKYWVIWFGVTQTSIYGSNNLLENIFKNKNQFFYLERLMLISWIIIVSIIRQMNF